MGCIRYLFVGALTVLLLGTVQAYALNTAVYAGQVFVAEEVVPPGHILMFAFQLHPDYLFTVSAKERRTGILLQWWRDEVSGAMTIQSSDTKQAYQFVFDNSNSVLTHKSVDFDIRVVSDPEYNMDKEQLDPIEAKIRSLSTRIHKMKSLQQTWRYQQRNHRATVEDVNERMLLWSILQIVGFVVACGGQLIMLKLFLEKKRTV